MTTELPWSVPIRLDEVPEGGKHVVLEPSAEVRAALAKPMGVDAVERLKAVVEVRRLGRDGLRVVGEVRATVRQTCVVSLTPLTNEIREPIKVDFVPPRSDKVIDINEIEIDIDASDEAEPLTGNSIDLGHVVTEFVTLAVDPYPRQPDAAFAPPAAGEGVAEAAANPFAALAALKGKGPKD
jgi:uncharacterized metal-binding protein YceD (DUF177 family)